MVKGHAQVKLLPNFKCFYLLFIYYSKTLDDINYFHLKLQVLIHTLENAKLLWTQKSLFWFQKMRKNGSAYFLEGQHMN